MPSPTLTHHPCKAPTAVLLPCARWHCHLSSVPHRSQTSHQSHTNSDHCQPWLLVHHWPGSGSPCPVPHPDTPHCQPFSGPWCEGGHSSGSPCTHPRQVLIPQPGRAGMGPGIATSSGASSWCHMGIRTHRVPAPCSCPSTLPVPRDLQLWEQGQGPGMAVVARPHPSALPCGGLAEHAGESL